MTTPLVVALVVVLALTDPVHSWTWPVALFITLALTTGAFIVHMLGGGQVVV